MKKISQNYISSIEAILNFGKHNKNDYHFKILPLIFILFTINEGLALDRIDSSMFYKTTLFAKRLLTDLYALSGKQRKKVTPARRGKVS
jgi:hypothetical protein